jgi:hypothetical protein
MVKNYKYYKYIRNNKYRKRYKFIKFNRWKINKNNIKKYK